VEASSFGRRVVELECGHPLMILPYRFGGWHDVPYGPWTDKEERDEMVCMPCDAWRKVIGPLPRVLGVVA
jgi:hypothetical protein